MRCWWRVLAPHANATSLCLDAAAQNLATSPAEAKYNNGGCSLPYGSPGLTYSPAASSTLGIGLVSTANALLMDGLQFTITDGAPSAPIGVSIHLSGGPKRHGQLQPYQIGFANAGFIYETISSPPMFGEFCQT